MRVFPIYADISNITPVLPIASAAGFWASLSFIFAVTIILKVSPSAVAAIVPRSLLSIATCPLSVLITKSASVFFAMESIVFLGISISVCFSPSVLLPSFGLTVISTLSDLFETASSTSLSAILSDTFAVTLEMSSPCSFLTVSVLESLTVVPVVFSDVSLSVVVLTSSELSPPDEYGQRVISPVKIL